MSSRYPLDPIDPAPRQNAWLWQTMALAGGALFLWIALQGLPGEYDKWRRASAMTKALDGDLEGALRDYDGIVKSAPTAWPARLERARLRKKKGDDAGAEEDFREAAKVAKDSPTAQLAMVELALAWRDHAEVARICERLDKVKKDLPALHQAQFHNTLAYFRAVVGVDLETALIDVNEALVSPRGSPSLAAHGDIRAMYLDTRAWTLHRLGRNAEGLTDMDEALSLIEGELRSQLREDNWPLSSGVSPKSATPLSKLEAFQSRHKTTTSIRKSWAVMRYHRAAILEALGDKLGAAADRDFVEALGFAINDDLY